MNTLYDPVLRLDGPPSTGSVPAIVDAAVVPELDAGIGNKIRAMVVLAKGHTGSADFAKESVEACARKSAHSKSRTRLNSCRACQKAGWEKF